MRLASLLVLTGLGLAMLASSGLASELPEGPLTLDDCLALAGRYSPRLLIARQDVVAAQAGLRRSLSSYYPSAAFLATQGRTGGSSFLETPAGTIPFTISTTRRESEVFLSHVFWQTGRRQAAGQARSFLHASRAGEVSAAQDLTLSVSQLYYAALAAEQLVGVSEATLAAARDHEQLARARAAVGEGALVDVVPAEADVADAEYGLLQVGNEAQLAKARLKNEIGLPPTYALRLAPAQPEDYETPLPPIAEALEASLANRPELAAARASVAAGRHSVRLAEAVEDVTINLSTQYERGISGPREGTSWSAILSATAFLFDGGARKADVVSARAALAARQAEQQQLVNAIGLEVESALLQAETARKSVDAAGKAAAAAEAQLAAAEVKYREGAGIFVEILDAQRAVARARTNHVQAMYDYATALVNLRKAMGVLAPPPAPENRT